jgi:hypothetical protein
VSKEIALDEDPDNHEAEHALSVLVQRNSKELLSTLKIIADSLINLFSVSTERFGDDFWCRIVENGIDPRSLTVFLSHVVKVCHSFE